MSRCSRTVSAQGQAVKGLVAEDEVGDKRSRRLAGY